jgi:hypothetical protein
LPPEKLASSRKMSLLSADLEAIQEDSHLALVVESSEAVRYSPLSEEIRRVIDIREWLERGLPKTSNLST